MLLLKDSLEIFNMNRLEGMAEGLHKARSGLIRALVHVEGGVIKDVIISGDYIMTPEHYADDMEKTLLGAKADRETILSLLKRFFSENRFQSPQTNPEDFAEAVMKAVEAKK